MREHLSCFFIILREVDLENVSPRVRWNLRGVCWNSDCRQQVSCSRFQEFPTPNSNAIIWKTKNFFSIFFCHFWKLHQILKILKKKMIFIANVCPILQTVKNFVTPLCKKRRFGTRFDSQHVKVSRILAKSPREHFYHVFSSFWGKLIWKMSPLVLGEILGVFVNTLTADGKYPVQGCENLHLPIQMQLSEKPNSILCSISWIYINF